MDPELLEILVCPRTKNPLQLADQAILKTVNSQIALGKVNNIGQELVTENISEALIDKKEKVLYIVRENIPILIYENGIRL